MGKLVPAYSGKVQQMHTRQFSPSHNRKICKSVCNMSCLCWPNNINSGKSLETWWYKNLILIHWANPSVVSGPILQHRIQHILESHQRQFPSIWASFKGRVKMFVEVKTLFNSVQPQNQKPQSSCVYNLPVGIGRHCKGITEGHSADWALLRLTWTLGKAARLTLRHLLADVSASTGLLYWQLAQQQLTPSTHQKKTPFSSLFCRHVHIHTTQLACCYAMHVWEPSQMCVAEITHV